MPPCWNPPHARTNTGALQDPLVPQNAEAVGPKLPANGLDDFPPHQGTPSNANDDDDEDPPEANLAQAILLMTHELRRHDTLTHKGKAKEPDTFDGFDPQKLNNFILLCNLYFWTNATYSEDVAKVTFTLSYLHGIALEYFELAILDNEMVIFPFTKTLPTLNFKLLLMNHRASLSGQLIDNTRHHPPAIHIAF